MGIGGSSLERFSLGAGQVLWRWLGIAMEGVALQG